MEIGNVKPVNVQVPGTSSDPEVTLPLQKSGTPMQQEAEKAEAEKQDPEKQMEKLDEAVDKLNKTSMIFDRSLRFQIHKATRETMVSVIDMNNDKVIREIPSEEVLDFVSKMRDYLGMIFDKKA
ncbi:MAG TPA: flagellar protein FlaG [Candidatus Ozemobacteraceae bacterium]|nr:flagellar protein FlaG [Candidatus Ozemobacteraceae bacterium]